MIYLNLLIFILSSILQVIIFDISFNLFAEKRFNKKWLRFIGMLLFAVLNTLCLYYIEYLILSTLINIVLVGIYTMMYKIKFWKRLLWITIISVIIIVLDLLISLDSLIDLAGSAGYGLNTFGTYVKFRTSLLDNILFSKIIVLGIALMCSHWKRKEEIKLRWQTTLLFIAMPIFSLVIFAESLSRNHDFASIILAIVVLLMLLLSNLMVFILFGYIKKQKTKETELSMHALQMNLEKQYYFDLTQKYILSNKTLHDLKHKLFAIESLLEQGDCMAKEEIRNVCNMVINAQIMKYTGNDAIDSLLNAKINIAKTMGIEIVITVWLSEVACNIIDLCVVLGNIVDNAINATEKVSENKFISVEIKQIEELISITVSNPSTKEGEKNKNEQNKYLHGYGLESVKEIVAKYNGDCRYALVDDMFTINILI